MSTLYAWFAVAGDPVATSRFYVLIVVSSILSVGWSYLLRLGQPWLVGRLVRTGAAGGWRWAGRILGAVLGLGAPAAAGLLAVALVAGRGTGLVVAAVGLEVGLYAGSAAAAVVLENIDAPGRRWSAYGATAQLATVVAAGWWLVPAAGAVGGLGALIAGELVRAAVLRALVARAASPERVP